MEVKAVEKYLRISPKKARPIAKSLKGKTATTTLDVLKYSKTKAAKVLYKAVKSAIANAENNHNLDQEKLYIKSISVDKGPILKRYRAGYKGSPEHIYKKSSNITVIVSDKKSETETPAKNRKAGSATTLLGKDSNGTQS